MTNSAWPLSRRKLLTLAACSLPGLALAAYPDKPIRLVSPFPAGGGSDFVARLIATRLQESLGQPVVVENKTGAAGMIGIEAVTRAPADGYTLVYLSSATTIQPWLTKVPYDIRKDLDPVSLAITVPYVLVSRAAGKYASVDEVIAAARAGAPVTYGSYGIGSPPHLIMEQLQSTLRINLTHVPYRGGQSMLPDLLSGNVDLGWDLPLGLIPNVRAKKLNALAVSSLRRVDYLPEARALGEIVQGLEMIGWGAVMVPAGTPPAIIVTLQREVSAALAKPDTAAKLREQGYTPVASTAQSLRETIDRDLQSWGKLIREKNIRSE